MASVDGFDNKNQYIKWFEIGRKCRHNGEYPLFDSEVTFLNKLFFIIGFVFSKTLVDKKTKSKYIGMFKNAITRKLEKQKAIDAINNISDDEWNHYVKNNGLSGLIRKHDATKFSGKYFSEGQKK
jgi:hypothetical protein